MSTNLGLSGVDVRGKTIEDLLGAYRQYTEQEEVKERIESSAEPEYQRSLIVSYLYYKQSVQNLKGDEQLSFSIPQVCAELGITHVL